MPLTATAKASTSTASSSESLAPDPTAFFAACSALEWSPAGLVADPLGFDEVPGGVCAEGLAALGVVGLPLSAGLLVASGPRPTVAPAPLGPTVRSGVGGRVCVGVPAGSALVGPLDAPVDWDAGGVVGVPVDDGFDPGVVAGIELAAGGVVPCGGQCPGGREPD